jgi:hypothetical protein
MTHVNKTRKCNYSLDAPDYKRYHSKHAEQPKNKGIINYPTQLHLVGDFIRIPENRLNLLSIVCVCDFPYRQYIYTAPLPFILVRVVNTRFSLIT